MFRAVGRGFAKNGRTFHFDVGYGSWVLQVSETDLGELWQKQRICWLTYQRNIRNETNLQEKGDREFHAFVRKIWRLQCPYLFHLREVENQQDLKVQ